MPTTIEDVARQAGVSKGTASLALNGRPNVSAHVRRRVIEASQALGYTPNRAARQLARTATRLFLVLHPRRVLHQHYPALEIIDGVRQAAQEVGATALMASFDPDDETTDLGRAYLRAKREEVSGVVLIGLLRGDTILNEITQASLACVVANRVLPAELGTSYVTVDHRLAGQLAAAHLVALGHRRVAFVEGDPRDWAHDDRRAGFASALQAAGLAPAWPETHIGVADAVARLTRDSAAVRPTGLVAVGDGTALQLIPELERAGLRVPQDVSVVGIDGIPASATSTPPLTTVKYDARLIGRQAIHLLNQQIDHPEIRVQSIVLGAELIERASSAPSVAAASGPAHKGLKRRGTT
jgi:LacI family transcriptional regulator